MGNDIGQAGLTEKKAKDTIARISRKENFSWLTPVVVGGVIGWVIAPAIGVDSQDCAEVGAAILLVVDKLLDNFLLSIGSRHDGGL